MSASTDTHPDRRTERRTGDRGFSFAEILATVVLIGVLATIVTAGVRNVTAEAADAGCLLDGRHVSVAATTYLELEGGESIPATGDGAERYELTLVEAGYLRAPSDLFELDADGTLIPQENSPC